MHGRDFVELRAGRPTLDLNEPGQRWPEQRTIEGSLDHAYVTPKAIGPHTKVLAAKPW